MARGSAVREFVSRLRERFFESIGECDNQEFIMHGFERAVNDTLLGSAEQPKPAAKKPRRKRRTKAQIMEAEGEEAHRG